MAHNALAAEKRTGGAVLQAINADTGEPLTSFKLTSPPVFDGLIATDGRLYLVTMDGKIVCYEGK